MGWQVRNCYGSTGFLPCWCRYRCDSMYCCLMRCCPAEFRPASAGVPGSACAGSRGGVSFRSFSVWYCRSTEETDPGAKYRPWLDCQAAWKLWRVCQDGSGKWTWGLGQYREYNPRSFQWNMTDAGAWVTPASCRFCTMRISRNPASQSRGARAKASDQSIASQAGDSRYFPSAISHIPPAAMHAATLCAAARPVLARR